MVQRYIVVEREQNRAVREGSICVNKNALNNIIQLLELSNTTKVKKVRDEKQFRLTLYQLKRQSIIIGIQDNG